MKKTSKIAFVGDVHIGNHKRHAGAYTAGINDRCWAVFVSLEDAIEHAGRSECDALVVLGDLFDSPNPSPGMFSVTQDILNKHPTVIIQGNHDQASDAPLHSALGPLRCVADVVSEPQVLEFDGVDLIAVPFQSGKCKDWLRKSVENLCTGQQTTSRVLAFHAGIVDDSTPQFMKDTDAAITVQELSKLCYDFGIDAAFAGHWHNPKVWTEETFFVQEDKAKQVSLVQAGALAPTGWNNEGMDYGNFYTYDTGQPKNKRLSVDAERISGPRFITINVGDDVSILKGVPRLREAPAVYVRIRADEHEAELAKEIIKAAISAGIVVSGEILYDTSETNAAARDAASKTRSSKTLEEAIVHYTEKMPLGEFVDIENQPEARLRIRELVTQFLAEGEK